MIKARHHIIIYPLFKRLTVFLLRWNFKSINIERNYMDSGHPVLVVANHISWWDGFWIMYLNLKTIKRRFHFMMLEEQLRKHWYFQYSGGYSIKKKSRDIMESIHYTIELLKHKENMVFIFPQGQIHSMYQNVITFEKGTEYIINKCSPETQILFVVNLPDYFSDARPNVFIFLKSFLAKDFQQSGVEREYNKFYKQVLKIQKTKVL